MSWLQSGLFRRFLTVMGALALIPVTILGFQLVDVSRKRMRTVHMRLAQNLAEQVDDSFRFHNEKLVSALSSVQRKAEPAARRRILAGLIEADPDILELSLLTSEGGEILRVFNPGRAAERAVVKSDRELGFQGYLKLRRRTIAVWRDSGLPLLYVYYPLEPGTMARTVVSLRKLIDRFNTERLGGTGFAVLVGSLGEPLLYPPERFQDPALKDFPQWQIVSAATKSGSLGATEFKDPQGRAYLGAYAPVFSIGSAVIFMQSGAEAYRAASRLKWSAIGVVLAVACVCFLGAGLVARRLTEPLLSLTRAAEAVSRGEFETKVEIATKDELQDLAETFNRMVAELRSYSMLHIDRLIAEQKKTEAILFSIDDGIIMTDREGRIQLANHRAVEILGLGSQVPLEGRTLAEAIPESPLREAIIQAAANPKPSLLKEVDLSTEHNRRFVHVTAEPVVTPSRGDTLGVVVVVRDATLEKELDKMKEEFLNYITHDLRNPLSSAMGFLDVLSKGTLGVLNPEQQKVVLSVKRSSTRLMGMVNNILDIAKMESGSIRLRLKNVSLAGLAGRSIGTLESLAQNKGIQIGLNAHEEFSVEADPDLIERVLTNLIGNAIKYTPERGRITVLIAEEGKALKVCVEDTGEGIAEEFRQRIFGKFEQVTGQRQGGTGLGLTIAKYFIEAHLGRIWVESRVGQGSRFYFILPKGLCLDLEGNVFVGEKVS